jgi:hypothetical protein
MKTILRKTICILIAFMMIIPAIPCNYAAAGEKEEVTMTIKANKVYERNVHFTSTNKLSNLQGFWEKGNNVYFAITIQHNKEIISAEYENSEIIKTVTGSAINHLDKEITKIIVEDKDDNTVELKAAKGGGQPKFVLINFGDIDIEDEFDLRIEIDSGEGHEFNGSVTLIEEPEEEDDDVGDDEGGDNEGGDNEGGDNEGGDNEGGDNESGDNEGGDNESGDNEGGDNEGGDDEGGDDEGGDDEGGDNEGGDDEGGDGEGGDNEGEDNEGGDDEGGDDDSGDNEGGDDDGGDDEGGDGEPNNNNNEEPKNNKKDSGRSSGGTIIEDTEIPLAELEKTDHFAYAIGYPEGLIKPLNEITREEVAMIFYRLLNDESRENLLSEANTFSDMDSQSWSNRAVSTLFNANIIKGYPDGTFRPQAQITRAEFATIAAKFDNLELGQISKFTDIAGHWAEEYITSSEIKGWIKGYPDLTFKPDEYITRAEAMTLINNVLGRIVRVENIHSDAILWTDVKETDWYYTVIIEATNSHDYVTDENGDEIWTGLKANKVWQ